ncbi:MAG: WecB/TagA/CpsF family glycosyltransferase [Treponemataceae bacterium]|nr:MAG: WecB/TagA/CpsF family glycosyltransferase [Treponemataceae bacterium]
MEVQRIHVLNVPVDICPVSALEEVILGLLQKEGPKQIVFLSLNDLLKARKNGEFRETIKKADLVLPISRSILRGATMLKLKTPILHNTFETVLCILTILETHYKSLYLFGGRKKTLGEAFKNVRTTYPSLQIVGRFVGYHAKAIENDIITAIRKTSASVVLFGDGIPDKLCWMHKRRSNFNAGIFIYYPEAIGIFSKTKKRTSNESRFGFLLKFFKNPFNIFLLFPYVQYNLLLVFDKFFVDHTQTTT